jgi:hypothetical protein
MSVGKLIDGITSNALPIAGGFAAGVITAPFVMKAIKKVKDKNTKEANAAHAAAIAHNSAQAHPAVQHQANHIR